MDLLQRAVANNVAWCSAVCPGATHSGTGIWTSDEQPVAYFPDAITTRRHITSRVLIAHLSDRTSCSVKDSYADLDLTGGGFQKLFDARWISSSAARGVRPAAGWEPVRTQPELDAWCAAADLDHLRRVDLLTQTHSTVFALRLGDRIVGGAIATASDKVVGITNAFHIDGSPRTVWSEISAVVALKYPDRPVVAYEHGEHLQAARVAGLTELGPLRVWHRPNPAPAHDEP